MTTRNIVSEISDFEAGELDDDEIIALFQRLVDSGLAWQLQGSYGRQAQRFIEAGLVSLPAPAARRDSTQPSPTPAPRMLGGVFRQRDPEDPCRQDERCLETGRCPFDPVCNN